MKTERIIRRGSRGKQEAITNQTEYMFVSKSDSRKCKLLIMDIKSKCMNLNILVGSNRQCKTGHRNLKNYRNSEKYFLEI